MCFVCRFFFFFFGHPALFGHPNIISQKCCDLFKPVEDVYPMDYRQCSTRGRLSSLQHLGFCVEKELVISLKLIMYVCIVQSLHFIQQMGIRVIIFLCFNIYEVLPKNRGNNNYLQRTGTKLSISQVSRCFPAQVSG